MRADISRLFQRAKARGSQSAAKGSANRHERMSNLGSSCGRYAGLRQTELCCRWYKSAGASGYTFNFPHFSLNLDEVPLPPFQSMRTSTIRSLPSSFVLIAQNPLCIHDITNGHVRCQPVQIQQMIQRRCVTSVTHNQRFTNTTQTSQPATPVKIQKPPMITPTLPKITG